MRKFFCFLAFISFTSGLLSAKGESFLMGQEVAPHIFVDNRILAIVNGKPLSIVDLTKKMDLLFYKQYPQYTHSPIARFQFYTMHWKQILQDLINKELVIADALDNKLPINNGEVRQEMETTFGPNIIANLDKAGMTFEEASQMMKEDLILRRMLHYRVNSKAVRKVTPQDVRNSYEEYIKTNVLPAQWTYRFVTIRNSDPELGLQSAQFAQQLLATKQGTFEGLQEKVSAEPLFGTSTKVTVSELLKHEEKDLSPSYKEILSAMTPDSFSLPVKQKSRRANETVFRFFYLTSYRPSGPPSFSEVANQLKEKLISEQIDKETAAYFNKIRQHYHVQDDDWQILLSNDFEPFSLR